MNIVNPHLLLLLLLLLPFIWLLLVIQKRYLNRFNRFADTSFWSFYLGELSFFFLRLKIVLLLLAYGLIVMGLARPQWDRASQDVKRSGLDIAICVDVSKSMDATDIIPTRLERAKDQISAFVDEQKGDRIALIPFAGIAYVQCPLTDDYEAVRMLLSSLNTNSVPVLGTDIGKALFVAGTVYDNNTKTKVVILISDGEDLGSNAMKQAKDLAQQGIIVYTMGVGTPGGSSVNLNASSNLTGGGKEEIITRLDNETLEKISSITGGEFYMITPAQDEIKAILKQISSLERGKLTALRIDLYKEQYHLFAIAALLLMVAEFLLSNRFNKTNGKKMNGSVIALMAIILMFALPNTNLHALRMPWSKAMTNSKGRTAYNKQDFKEAEKLFTQNSKDFPNDKILPFNLGNSYYQLNNPSEANRAWQEAASSKIDRVKSKAYYNLGNAQFKGKDYGKAMDSYRMAILADNSNHSARLNYDLAKRMLMQQNNSQNSIQQDNNEMKHSPKTDKQEAAERILKALEQKEVTDRQNRQQEPQRMQNNKWW